MTKIANTFRFDYSILEINLIRRNPTKGQKNKVYVKQHITAKRSLFTS